MDLFRRLFGFSNDHPQSKDSKSPETFRPPISENHERFLKFDDNEPNFPSNGNFGSNFNVFTDPLEMHRYFEQQMDSFLKSFGMPSGTPNFEHFFFSQEHPDKMNDPFGKHLQEDFSQNSRENFLKKDYEQPNYDYPGEKVDKDLDGKLSITDLDTILKGPSDAKTNIIPPNKNHRFGGPRQFGGTFFNQSVQIKTIKNPDGSLESHRIASDNAGNEETTITRKLGDKEYTVVKKRDREGREEIHENMVNMTEDEKSLFNKPKPIEPSYVEPSFDDSLFSKFFK